MKTNAIVRIVLFSIAILLLLSILGAVLTFGLYTADGNYTVTTTSQNIPISEDGGNSVTADPGTIRSIEIDWASGSITIEPTDTDQIIVTETNASNEKDRMVCKQSGSTLKIEYCEESISFPSFGINIDFSKDLIIEVPADWICEELEIDAASADVTVNDLTIREVDFDGASSTCDFENCQIGKLDFDGASGDICLIGTLNELNFDGASASCYLELTNVPDRIKMDGMSGDLELALPEDCGFTVSIDAMSSGFHSDFPTTMSGGNYVYGDGHCRISFSGMSGDLTIRKAS